MIPPLLPLTVFPIVSFVLFRVLDRRAALVWTVLLGYMFIPTAAIIDLPVLPRLDKFTVPAMCGLLFMWMTRPKRGPSDPGTLPGLLPELWLIRTLVFAMMAGAFLTVATNTDPLVYGPTSLPAMRIYDGFSSVLTAIMLILPMLVARKYFNDDAAHMLLLKSLMIAGVIYALPVIYELVMSPQLNRMLYGYFPHNWQHHVRAGGYRPVVFLEHGLMMAILMCCLALAALGAARTASPDRKALYYAVAIGLILLVTNLNALGVLVLLALLVPVLVFLGTGKQLLVCAIISGCILTYPALRGGGLIPTQMAVDLAGQVEVHRASSLETRFINEDRLLEKANERPLFGWGRWNRARVFDDRGRDISVTDGAWVIQIGQAGWVGYLSLFGLLCAPAILLARRARSLQVGMATAALSVVLTANLIDMIPNDGLSPVTWLLAGALIGRLERRPDIATSPAEADTGPAPPNTPGYTRFPPKAGPSSPARASARAGRPMRARPQTTAPVATRSHYNVS